VRRVADILTKSLGFLTPAIAMRAADVLAPAGRLVRTLPDAEDLRRVLPQLSEREAKRIAARILRMEARNHVLVRWLKHGGRARIRGLLLHDAPPILPAPPLILGTFHMGPIHALGAALEGTPLLALRNTGNGNQQRRAAAFYHATARLRNGEVVLMALDPQRATRITVPFLGGALNLARGAFTLSRTTGAPIVPIAARWHGMKVEVVCGEKLEGSDERELAQSAARWLERYLLDNPAEISLRILDLMER
jgi:lauroyl/myristoyl acyltransferase